MRVIAPLAVISSITPAMLISSTCAEPHATEVLYNSGSAYGLGDVVVSPITHRKYESLKAANTGNALPAPPTLDDPTPSTDWWLDIGPSNRWAMFDLLRDTQTSQASPLTVVIQPGQRVDSVALLGLEADSVTITVKNGSELVYAHTENLGTREVFDWYDYFFEPFSSRSATVRWDLPPYTDAVITIVIAKATGNVKCGACVIGSCEFIGNVEYRAVDDKLNFSKMERTFDGGSLLRPRRNVPKTTQQLVLPKNHIRSVRRLRDALTALPAVWSGLDDDTDGYFESLFILGYYKQFSISLEYPTFAQITLELEEI